MDTARYPLTLVWSGGYTYSGPLIIGKLEVFWLRELVAGHVKCVTLLPALLPFIINSFVFDFWFYLRYRSHWKLILYGNFGIVRLWNWKDLVYKKCRINSSIFSLLLSNNCQYVARIFYQRHADSHDRLSLLFFSKIKKFWPVQPLIVTIQNMI